MVYGTVLQAFRSQGTHAHLLVADRAAQSTRDWPTFAAQSYQRQSRTSTESLVWEPVFSERGADPLCLSSPTPREACSITVETGSGVWAPEIANRLDAGIDRRTPHTPGRTAHGVPRIDLSIHVLSSSNLIGCLPRHHAKWKPKRPYRTTGERIKNRTGLEQRPKAADTRQECGHWEADMIVAGDRQHGLNVLVDRKSRLTHIQCPGEQDGHGHQAGDAPETE